MKSKIFTAALVGSALLPATLLAQTNEEPAQKVQSPKLVIGLQTGISQTYRPDAIYTSGNAQPGKTGSGIGLYARYFLSEHWAIESGINYNISNGLKLDGYISDYQGNFSRFYQKRKELSIEVPVQVQYHLLKKENKIRPYFGAGFAFNSHHDQITQTISGSNSSRTDVITDKYVRGYAFVTQGITWQINQKWQINQSFRYKFNGNTNGLDLKIGIGYTIK